MAIEPSWRSLTISALAALIVGFAGSYLWHQPAAVAMLGGGAPAPVVDAPKDEVVRPADLLFRWRGLSDATRIVVIDLEADKEPVVDRVVQGDRYEPTAEERARFLSGRRYHWFVEAQIEGGWRSSTAAQFTMR